MALLRGLFWFALFLVLTFCFVVLFEYGPRDFASGAQKEYARIKSILSGHTLSELRWQNRAARTRTAPRNKKSGLGTERTKKGRAGAPCQNVSVTLVLSTAAKADASCKL